MNKFLEDNGFLFLLEDFQQNDVNDDNFCKLDLNDIQKILSPKYPTDILLKFVHKHSINKGLLKVNVEIEVEHEKMECENANDNSLGNEDVDMAFANNNINSEDSEVNSENKSEFVYEDTPLYRFLSNPVNVYGVILLNNYKTNGILDYQYLIDQAVLYKIQNNVVQYDITEDNLVDLACEIVQLFPNEDISLLYSKSCKSTETSEASAAGGSLYFHLNYLRKLLKKANVIGNKKSRGSRSNSIENEKLNCLTDTNRDSYTPNEIITQWNDSYINRTQALERERRKKLKTDQSTLTSYLESFPCLCPPLGVSLLEADFRKNIQDRAVKETVISTLPESCSNLFSRNWGNIATEKVLPYIRHKKRSGAQTFLTENASVLAKGDRNAELALLALSRHLVVPKTMKIDGHTITITKSQVVDSFILYVQELSEVDSKRTEVENLAKSLGLPIHPYVIWYGKLEENVRAYVVLNGFLYHYDDPVKAFEACFKCLVALRSWPFMCDFVWIFIQKYVYGLIPPKNYQCVTKLCSELRKYENN